MILELKNLYKAYVQGNMYVPVLKDINFSVEEGEYVAIMGPSGSGKSTLMNIIGCLDKASSGVYMLNDEDVSSYNDKQLSYIRNKNLGFVFQTFNLLPRQSALDNVALPLQYAGVPRNKRKEICLEALDMVGLSDRVNFKPTQLSGGQKQRVAIARALVKNPEIIMADEPTGALDSATGKQVFDTLKELSKEKLVLIVSHDRDFAEQYADRIIELADGKIISDVERAPINEQADNESEETQAEEPLTFNGDEIDI
ncbi:MAG: ABC transporter ATP-binding protein, partial [Lachnospiraceae bacterium]|nr:ABC transporter ATP-binding protein [Lachnospiraceae bacterium]